MNIERITISVPNGVARRIKKAAANRSVSAWVTGIIEERLDDEALEHLWQEFYRSVGPQPEDVRRANALFKQLTKPQSTKPRKKSAA